MDIFLRAVGFSKTRLSAFNIEMKDEILKNPDKRVIFGGDDDRIAVEYYKMYGENIGLLLRGHMDENENVEVESIESFATADRDAKSNKYIVEYAADKPVIVFEDSGTGNELVFLLQNTIDLERDEKYFIDYGRSVEYTRAGGIKKRRVNFTAFSTYGSIILPVYHEDEDYEEILEEESFFKSLVLRYKEGDVEAAEMLKMYAEETTSVIQERLKEEDLLSVVEGYFLPAEDCECDYSVLGDIIDSSLLTNTKTGEQVVKLTLNITGTDIQLFINKKDILGMPIKGMRFMGSCRLKGSVIFE